MPLHLAKKDNQRYAPTQDGDMRNTATTVSQIIPKRLTFNRYGNACSYFSTGALQPRITTWGPQTWERGWCTSGTSTTHTHIMMSVRPNGHKMVKADGGEEKLPQMLQSDIIQTCGFKNACCQKKRLGPTPPPLMINWRVVVFFETESHDSVFYWYRITAPKTRFCKKMKRKGTFAVNLRDSNIYIVDI